jgi:hypothetical protein
MRRWSYNNNSHKLWSLSTSHYTNSNLHYFHKHWDLFWSRLKNSSDQKRRDRNNRKRTTHSYHLVDMRSLSSNNHSMMRYNHYMNHCTKNNSNLFHTGETPLHCNKWSNNILHQTNYNDYLVHRMFVWSNNSNWMLCSNGMHPHTNNTPDHL